MSTKVESLTANVHGLGPDTATGPNPLFEGTPIGLHLKAFLSDQGKRVSENYPHLHSFIPERVKGGNAYDVRAAVFNPQTIYPGKTLTVPLGFHGTLSDENFVGLLLPRSGLGTKRGFILRNSVGVIDWNYQAEWNAVFVNNGNTPFFIYPGDRIAQVLFLPVVYPEVYLLESGSFEEESERGVTGFGDSGVE